MCLVGSHLYVNVVICHRNTFTQACHYSSTQPNVTSESPPGSVGKQGAGYHLSTVPVIHPDQRCVFVCTPGIEFSVLVNEMDLFSDVMIGCWSEPMGHYLSLSDVVELCVCADAQLRFSTATICIALKREKIIISLTLASLSSPFLRAQVYLLVLRALWFTRSDENVLFCVSVRNSLQPSSVFCNSSRLFTPFRKMWRGFSELWESSLSFTYLGQMSWVRSWLVVVARASLRDSRQNFNGLAPSLLGPMRG